MYVRVIKPGMLTTVQDRGRWGLQARGVPVAGPMDPVSHRLANALVGNDADAAPLDMTLLDPELQFEVERGIAVAGAYFDMTIINKPVAMNASFIVSAESRLGCGPRGLGPGAYLAIAGGIAIPPTLGSRSTHLISAL